MLYTKFQPNISRDSGAKFDYSGLAILATAANFYSRYHSEVLQPRHAACEI